jgi:multimeric flavodoxin WrbA
MKTVLIFKSSPRERGNSATLADRAAAGAREAGAQVEMVSLHGLGIGPCDGCDMCKDTGNFCIIDDDMQSLYPRLLAADAVVLASPIYWFTFSAQLKLFIDRWYGLVNNQQAFLRGKPVGIILTYGDTDPYTSGGINAIHTFESMFGFLQAPIAGIVHGTAGEPGDAEKNPALMQAAYELGKRLAG